MKTFRILTPLLIVVGLLWTATAQAQDAGLKQSFANRLPQVDALKKALLVGENNQAYLEARASLNSGQKAIMDAENADRRKLYSMIAGKRGVSISVVEKTRAADILEGSRKAGGLVWVEDPSGNWKKL